MPPFSSAVTITLKDETFQNLADGKVNGQKVTPPSQLSTTSPADKPLTVAQAFMSGQLKVRLLLFALPRVPLGLTPGEICDRSRATSCSPPSSTRSSSRHKPSPRLDYPNLSLPASVVSFVSVPYLDPARSMRVIIVCTGDESKLRHRKRERNETPEGGISERGCDRRSAKVSSER